MIETISSKLNNVEITTLPSYLNYRIVYSDGIEIENNQELKANTKETLKIRVEYKRDIEVSDLPSTTQSLGMNFSVTYIQSSSNATSVPHAVSFEEDSWNTIVATVRERDASIYSVGQTKTINLGTFGNHQIRIVNNSTPSECSAEGYSQTACGFVLEFADIIVRHSMNSTSTYVGGWAASDLRTYINSDIYNSLPEVIRNAIITTKVISGHGNTNGENNFVSMDKLYLVSEKEIWGNDSYTSWDSAKSLTRQLDYYQSQQGNEYGFPAAVKSFEETNIQWWTRTATSSQPQTFVRVSGDGGRSDDSATANRGVSPAFRLG